METLIEYCEQMLSTEKINFTQASAFYLIKWYWPDSSDSKLKFELNT